MTFDSLGRISPFQMANLIPLPSPDCNKYSRGALVVVGGSAAYPGAAALAACAGQRMGAGYTQVWCAPESVSDVRAGHPSLVVRPWNASDRTMQLRKLNGKAAAVVLGCGFEAGGLANEEPELLFRALEMECPVLVDGGGLTVLANYVRASGTRLLKERADEGLPLVLTPHGGEAARLAYAAGLTPAEQPQMARDLAEAYNATVVLKGPQTVIWGEGSGWLMSQGTAALAKAGTGDVLAGMIGALLAQGVSPVQAGCLGSSLHAHAGCLAAEDATPIGVIPEDVIAHLPQALKDYLALRQN